MLVSNPSHQQAVSLYAKYVSMLQEAIQADGGSLLALKSELQKNETDLTPAHQELLDALNQKRQQQIDRARKLYTRAEHLGQVIGDQPHQTLRQRFERWRIAHQLNRVDEYVADLSDQADRALDKLAHALDEADLALSAALRAAWDAETVRSKTVASFNKGKEEASHHEDQNSESEPPR